MHMECRIQLIMAMVHDQIAHSNSRSISTAGRSTTTRILQRLLTYKPCRQQIGYSFARILFSCTRSYIVSRSENDRYAFRADCASTLETARPGHLWPLVEFRMSKTCYRIVKAAEWAEAQAAGHYVGSPLDARDGYMHMSPADQVRTTAEKYYKGATDLVLLTVDVDSLGSNIVWEPVASRNNALFPHLYNVPLPISAVKEAVLIKMNDDGSFAFPAGIP